MSDFFDAIRRFLLDYLPKQRCLSKNTILSYRQTLNIFVVLFIIANSVRFKIPG